MSFDYQTRIANHGVSYAWFSKITADPVTGVVTFGNPLEFTGLRGCNFETSQESNNYYADNVVHISILGRATVEGDLTAYQIRQEFMTDHLGKKLTTSSPPALLDTGSRSNFVWCYAETVTDQFGNEVFEYQLYTNVQAGSPTGEAVTDEEAPEPKEFTIPVTAITNPEVRDIDGKEVTVITWRDDLNGTVWNLMQRMFGVSADLTVNEFIDTALGKLKIAEPPTPPITP